MAGDFHDDRFGNACPSQISDRGARKSANRIRHSGALTRLTPAFAEIFDRVRTARKQILARPRLHLKKLRHVAVDGNRHRFGFS